MQQMIFIADFIACSTCFGHHYAHTHTQPPQHPTYPTTAYTTHDT